MDNPQTQYYGTRQQNIERFSSLAKVYRNDCLPVQNDSDIKMRVLEMSWSNLVGIRSHMLSVGRLYREV
jgi:hypothetical protein